MSFKRKRDLSISRAFAVLSGESNMEFYSIKKEEFLVWAGHFMDY